MKTKVNPKILLASLTVLLVATPLPELLGQASNPVLIPFQGRLTDQSGNPYIDTDGPYTLTFNIYTQAVGGTSVWTERHENVGVVNGMVNVFLGAIEPFPATADFFSTPNYLGIAIDADGNPLTADPEMVPRQLLVPAFHARNASDSQMLAGHDWSDVFSSNDPTASTILLDRIPSLNDSKILDVSAGKITGTLVSSNLPSLLEPTEIDVGSGKAILNSVSGGGRLFLNGANNSLNVALGAKGGGFNDHGQISVWENNGSPKGILEAKPTATSGYGTLQLYGENGSTNVFLGSSNDIASGISDHASGPNAGFLGVADATGLVRTGFYIHSGGGSVITTNVTIVSDSRLKTDVAVMDNALSSLRQIRGVSYRRKDLPSSDRHVGVIAQEVQAVLPEAVVTMDFPVRVDKGPASPPATDELAGPATGSGSEAKQISAAGNDEKGEASNPPEATMMVNYNCLTALLIEAVKEQQLQIEKQKRLITKMNERIAHLEKVGR